MCVGLSLFVVYVWLYYLIIFRVVAYVMHRVDDYANMPGRPSWRPVFLKDIEENSTKGVLLLLGAAAIFYFVLTKSGRP